MLFTRVKYLKPVCTVVCVTHWNVKVAALNELVRWTLRVWHPGCHIAKSRSLVPLQAVTRIQIQYALALSKFQREEGADRMVLSIDSKSGCRTQPFCYINKIHRHHWNRLFFREEWQIRTFVGWLAIALSRVGCSPIVNSISRCNSLL